MKNQTNTTPLQQQENEVQQTSESERYIAPRYKYDTSPEIKYGSITPERTYMGSIYQTNSEFDTMHLRLIEQVSIGSKYKGNEFEDFLWAGIYIMDGTNTETKMKTAYSIYVRYRNLTWRVWNLGQAFRTIEAIRLYEITQQAKDKARVKKRLTKKRKP